MSRRQVWKPVADDRPGKQIPIGGSLEKCQLRLLFRCNGECPAVRCPGHPSVFTPPTKPWQITVSPPAFVAPAQSECQESDPLEASAHEVVTQIDGGWRTW